MPNAGDFGGMRGSPAETAVVNRKSVTFIVICFLIDTASGIGYSEKYFRFINVKVNHLQLPITLTLIFSTQLMLVGFFFGFFFFGRGGCGFFVGFFFFGIKFCVRVRCQLIVRAYKMQACKCISNFYLACNLTSKI